MPEVGMRVGVRTGRIARAVVLAAALVAMLAVPAAAGPGELDPAFGVGGTAVTEFPSSYSGARAVAVQADGRVVAAGFTHTDDSILQDVALVRYDASGVLDQSFGDGGRVRTDFGGRFDEGLAVAVQADGRIVVAGSSSDGTGADMAVARYTRDGTLDVSFDGDGMALVDFGGEAVARAVAVQRDGKVVLAGWAVQFSGAGCCAADFALARLTTAGALDDSFGGDGRVTTDFVGDRDEVRDLAVDTDGRVVAGRQSCQLPGQSDEVCDFGLARYGPSGRLDRRFGSHGEVRTDLGAEFGEGVRGVVLQRDGRIVAGGDTQGPGGFDVGLARYRSDGRLDHGFGAGGVVVTPVSPTTDEVGGPARGPAGRVMVAGTTAVAQGFGFFVSSHRLT
jgi:uncharacterized delta-60 repeat protein